MTLHEEIAHNKRLIDAVCNVLNKRPIVHISPAKLSFMCRDFIADELKSWAIELIWKHDRLMQELNHPNRLYWNC